MPKFAKGSKEAKDYMASIRAKKSKSIGGAMTKEPMSDREEEIKEDKKCKCKCDICGGFLQPHEVPQRPAESLIKDPTIEIDGGKINMNNKKGSPEAIEWGKKMKEARMKKLKIKGKGPVMSSLSEKLSDEMLKNIAYGFILSLPIIAVIFPILSEIERYRALQMVEEIEADDDDNIEEQVNPVQLNESLNNILQELEKRKNPQIGGKINGKKKPLLIVN